MKFLSKTHTPPIVRQYLGHGLFSWLENGRYRTEPPPTSIDPRLKRTMAMQDAIGWHHFVRGRVAMEWGHIINDHIAQSKTTKITAEQWCAQLLAINWKHILLLWQVRNTEVHGSTKEEATLIQKTKLIEEIIYLRNKYPDIQFNTRQLINKSRAELELLPVGMVATYLYSVKLVITAHRKHAKNARSNTISQYFPPSIPMTHKNPEDKSDLDPGESS
jgi:hypothetical protein